MPHMDDQRYGAQKGRRKIVRSLNQLFVLLILAVFLVLALTTVEKYEPYDPALVTGVDNGFITVSYFGTALEGGETLISAVRLEEQLSALKDSGYVTITQQDILDYYEKGKLLPERALFLMFEDGRRDTAVFAEKILEKLNQKATVLTYADKFEKRDNKFLTPKELLELRENTFWELGTNGYRLAFINVFDRYDNYFGQLNSVEFNRLSPYVDRNYNHFLMDFIRDAYDIPQESQAEMKARIEGDYAAMRRIYQQKLGAVPGLYILMHSNTGMFATNEKASAVNEQEIYNTFSMNFNREGFSLNTAGISRYDLTRMQPQAYWSANHVLMRIWDDTGLAQAFRPGRPEIYARWEVIKGAAECTEDGVTLTTLPQGEGLMRLKGSERYEDLELRTGLKGNQLGAQTVYLRANDDLSAYVAVRLKNNVLQVLENTGSGEQALYTLTMAAFDGIPPITKGEDRLASEAAARKTKRTYGDKTLENREIIATLEAKENESAEDDEAIYEPLLERNATGDRHLALKLRGDALTVIVDQEPVAVLTLAGRGAGSVYLESGAPAEGYSQRNLTDDVYDGVFDGLLITPEEGEAYDVRLTGVAAFFRDVKKGWTNLINWFVEIL